MNDKIIAVITIISVYCVIWIIEKFAVHYYQLRKRVTKLEEYDSKKWEQLTEIVLKLDKKIDGKIK